MFTGIEAFIALGETGSFSAAAKRLGVSTSHVSRQVAALEERLGVRLVARTTRKVRLTNAGTGYFRRCQDIAQGLREADQLVSREVAELSGQLRVSAAGEFAETHIAPVLIDFANAHPLLSIEMDFNTRFVNFIDDGFDFAIRYGVLEDSSMIARKLADRTMVAMAATSYINQYGQPHHPSALKHHHCIIANNDHWHFLDEKNPISVRVNGRWRCNSARAIVDACQKGLGIAYMPRSSFAQALDHQALVPVLEGFWTQDIATWIVYPNRQFVPARARLAIDYLLDAFRDWRE